MELYTYVRAALNILKSNKNLWSNDLGERITKDMKGEDPKVEIWKRF